MTNKGLFICFEGADGSGKTTIINLLKENLKKINGYKEDDFIFTREPGGTYVGEKIRDMLSHDEMDIKTEALLFAASRREHIIKKIIPEIKNNKVIFCDRYVHSSLAFQGVFKKVGIDKIWEINQFAIDDLVPDVVFFVDVPVEVSLQRLNNRKEKIDRLDLTTKKQIEEINNAYKEALKYLKKSKIIILDGTKSPKEIANQIIDYLNNNLN